MTEDDIKALAACLGHPEGVPGQWTISPAMHLSELDPVDVDWIAAARALGARLSVAEVLEKLDARP